MSSPPSPTSQSYGNRNLSPTFMAASPPPLSGAQIVPTTQNMIQVVKQTPEILELKMVERNLKLTGDQIQRWKSKLEACINSNTHLNFLEYIHSDAQQFIKDRFQLYDDQRMTNWAVEWNSSWSAKVFFDAIDIIWPKGVENAVDFSIESRLNRSPTLRQDTGRACYIAQ